MNYLSLFMSPVSPAMKNIDSPIQAELSAEPPSQFVKHSKDDLELQTVFADQLLIFQGWMQ